MPLQRAEVEMLVGQAQHALVAQRAQYLPESRLAPWPGHVDPAHRHPAHHTPWCDGQHSAFSNACTAGPSRPPPQRQRITHVALSRQAAHHSAAWRAAAGDCAFSTGSTSLAKSFRPRSATA